MGAYVEGSAVAFGELFKPPRGWFVVLAGRRTAAKLGLFLFLLPSVFFLFGGQVCFVA